MSLGQHIGTPRNVNLSCEGVCAQKERKKERNAAQQRKNGQKKER